MGESVLGLYDIFNMSEWGKLLRTLSDVFGIAITMTDIHYNVVTEPAGQSEFCLSVLNNAAGNKLCMMCASLGGLEAMRTNKPFISHCHAGCSFGCVPVTVQGRYMGIICFGQVRIKGETKENRSDVINGTRSMLADGENDALRSKLCELFAKLPELEADKLYKIGELIWSLTNYIIETVTALKSENRSYEWVVRNAITPLIMENNDILKPIEEAPVASALPLPENHRLYPALAYIEEHPKCAVSMHEMADLCKLSHSYFSKIFARDVGKSFTDYCTGRKMQFAAGLLHNGSDSIAEIAASLGFSDTSYFVKVFKKINGTTPLAYRQLKYLK